MAVYNIGDIIVFSYPLEGTQATDTFPKILVLHNGYPAAKPLVHGLAFKLLTDDEINLLRMMVNVGFRLEYMINLQKKNPKLMQQFDAIIEKTKSASFNITSPLDFYIRVIQPFIITRSWEPYRRYTPSKITNVRVITQRRVFTGEDKAGIFGTSKSPRGKGKSEKEILKDLAELYVAEEQSLGGTALTPQERQFINRLIGDAQKVFDDFVKKFQYAKGPRLPTFQRYS